MSVRIQGLQKASISTKISQSARLCVAKETRLFIDN